MELSSAQKVLLAIPSKWPPILLGIILSLFISAIFTSNFAMQVIPSSDSSSSSAAPWAPSQSSTISSISSRLFFFLFRHSHTRPPSAAQDNIEPGNSEAVLPLSESGLNHSLPSQESTLEPDGRSHLPINSASTTAEAQSSKSTGASSSVSSDALSNVANGTLEINRSGARNDSTGLNKTVPVSVTDVNGTLLLKTPENVKDRSSSSLLNVSDPLSYDRADVVAQVDEKLLPSRQPASPKTMQCDISVGSWVEDDTYPMYSPSTCPYVDESFNCQQNGRPDSKYNKWRWVPRDCSVPRFNGTHFMEVLRGKRLVFAGDSLNRNQWESLLCMLREGMPDKRRVVQVHGGRISKLPGAYIFKFLDYDFKVEFYTSPYLVDKEDGVNYTDFRVRLDRMDISERRWRKADVLVFNTGHWWTPDKIGKGENRFQEGLEVHKMLSVSVAYSKALSTWGKWVDSYVNPENTTVFFRGYSPIHYVGGQWNSGGQCQDEREPIFNETFIAEYPEKMKVLDEVLLQMKVPVQVLNITRLSDFRKDAHPALYGHAQHQEGQYQDCSHWCLPGLPDTWNELLYFAIVNSRQGHVSP